MHQTSCGPGRSWYELLCARWPDHVVITQVVATNTRVRKNIASLAAIEVLQAAADITESSLGKILLAGTADDQHNHRECRDKGGKSRALPVEL